MKSRDGTSEPGEWITVIAEDADSIDCHAFILEVVAAGEEPQVEIGLEFLKENKLTRLALLHAFDKNLPREEVLLSGVKELEPYVRIPESMPLLIGTALDFLKGIPPESREKSQDLLEAYGADSPLAQEFAKAACLLGPEPEYAHYLDYLENGEVSPTARLALYQILKERLDPLPEAFTRKAAQLVALSWESRSPVPHVFTRETLARVLRRAEPR